MIKVVVHLFLYAIICVQPGLDKCNTYRHITKFLYEYPLKDASLTDSPAPGKSGIAAEWKALRAFSDALRQAHVIPCKRRANILQSAWYLPEACIVHLRSRPKYPNIMRMSSKPAFQPSSEDKSLLLISQGFMRWSYGVQRMGGNAKFVG